MKYGEIVRGKFQKRINRFIAEVLLERSNNPNRKTKYSLIAVKKQNLWVNIDSQAPNTVAYNALKEGKIIEFSNFTTFKREVSFGHSRFDLYVENEGEKGFIEIKGVTLEKDGLAMFPDAPTTRGTKHVLELMEAIKEGYTGTVLFIVQMEGCHTFTPNTEMDPAFSRALKQAQEKGVQILAYDTVVTENELTIGKPIAVTLEN